MLRYVPREYQNEWSPYRVGSSERRGPAPKGVSVSGPTESTKGRPLRYVRPSYILLLSAVPFIIYLFLSAPTYREALAFLAPGLWITVSVTMMAYIAASVLGLVLAGLLLLKLGKRTLLLFGIAALVLIGLSAFFFTRPKVSYSLIGEPEGRVAIVAGTPARLSDLIKEGRFDAPVAETSSLSVRAAPTAEDALERLEEGVVAAAFVPTDSVPAGVATLWETTFLPESARRPGLALAVFGTITVLLTFAAWQSAHHPLAIFAELYVDMIRGIPMLVIILYVGFPLQGAIRDATGGFIDMSRLTRGVVAISLGYAAYMAEIFRAGIEAIPKGQVEAAQSLGLSGWQTARHVVLPQALRIVIPPLGNEFIAMLKDTSLLSILSVRDITQRAREFQAATFEVFPPFNTVAILYISLTLAASSLIKGVERRTKRGTR